MRKIKEDTVPSSPPPTPAVARELFSFGRLREYGQTYGTFAALILLIILAVYLQTQRKAA